jgi:hypothetical protein
MDIRVPKGKTTKVTLAVGKAAESASRAFELFAALSTTWLLE